MPPVANGTDSSSPSRSNALGSQARHSVNGRRIKPPFPDETERVLFAMGCFWGAELFFQRLPGVHTTKVGYMGGSLPKPTYQQVCTGATGHAEVVDLQFHPAVVSYKALLNSFWAWHDPTTLNRQGNDRGTQYRSVIFYYGPQQRAQARAAIAAETKAE